MNVIQPQMRVKKDGKLCAREPKRKNKFRTRSMRPVCVGNGIWIHSLSGNLRTPPFGVTFSLFSVLPIVVAGVAAAAAGFVPDSKSIDFIVDDAYF